ncbi:MAG: leader peptidase (prepilin peptidase)/N-methyltransferase [Porticoccus sp.]|jgi:leader peptidase (prepilin peptidase)/N-methyltransferase
MPDTMGLPPTLIITASLILGLMIGSFLNVVIYRLPLQLSASWRRESLDFLGMEPDFTATNINIAWPPSHCPKCGTKVKPWQNIPVFSYLLLKGKCNNCAARISLQYPLIEISSALITTFVVYRFGLTSTGFIVLLFSWSLVALTGIDFNEQLLPDNITLPLLWLGLLVNVQSVFAPLSDAVIGATAGYLCLWSIFWVFKLLTGKEGMGHGDFKLLAALGAWMGWQQLLLIVLLSSLVGAVVGIAMIAFLGRDKQIPIPFGPYLAAAGWIALIWGDHITGHYLALFN